MRKTDAKEKTDKKRALLVAGLLVSLFLASCIWIIFFGAPASAGALVCVYHEGTLLASYPLEEDGIHPVELEDGGVNVIEIKDGGVRMLEADCDNQVCVQTGIIRSGAYPIVCLPHGLVVQIEEGDKAPDAMAR